MNGKKLSEIKYGWFLFIVDFILPLPLTALALWLWYLRTANFAFTLYVVLLPLFFGYLIPGIATNKLRLWAFKWNYLRVGNYFLHHGFMYAPYFALSLYATFGEFGPLSVTHWITILISNSFLQCFLTSLHDYLGLQSGMIEIYNKPYREGKSKAEIFLDYGPVGYALFGFTYTLSCLLAHTFLNGSVLNFILFLLAGLALMSLAGVHYLFHEKIWKSKVH